MSGPGLVPIRVDATSENATIRLVETLLFDPSCWPIPLYEPLQESVERNVQHFADTIIADAEVIGMGRTVRHFTGRVELWSKSLHDKVASQIRSQLWNVVSREGKRPPHKRTPPEPSKVHKIKLRLTVNGVAIHDDFDWDTSLQQSPITFAQRMGKDLNLPEEATIAIATSIVEQLNGVKVDPGKPSSTLVALLDPRDQVANIGHTVALHRPSNLDRRVG